MRIRELVLKLPFSYRLKAKRDSVIRGISSDSRSLKRGDMFFALSGGNYDGCAFITQAAESGACGIVVDKSRFKKFSSLSDKHGIFVLGVTPIKSALSYASKIFYGLDENRLRIVGITGTNGKTTTSILIENILSEYGAYTCRVGTLGYRISRLIKTEFTTPQPHLLYKILSSAQNKGVEFVIMEVSSQGLEERRVDSLRFDTAVFTNLSPDHLDYHARMENYFQSKQILFKLLKRKGKSVINVDCPYGRRLHKKISGDKNVLSVSLTDRQAFLRLVSLKQNGLNQEIEVGAGRSKRFKIKTSLPGKHNVYNILLSIGACLSLGVDLDSIVRGIQKTRHIPGRLQYFQYKGIVGFVDYAHTPDALFNVLSTLKSMNFRRIITVFGCGGNRDSKKRPRMGRIASRLSDYVIVTDDNPRYEDPVSIIRDITSGIKKQNFTVKRPREAAIRQAVRMSRAGDVLLVAGKGHERYQIIRDRRIFFDDYDNLKKNLRCLK